MLEIIAIPLEAYRPLETRHFKLLVALVSFTDPKKRDPGVCWPGMRTIANQAGECLTWTQRNLAEMEKLGYFTRMRGPYGRYTYKIAERFLPRWPCKQVSCPSDVDPGPEEPAKRLSNLPPLARSGRTAHGTKGFLKDKISLDSKREDGPVRLAPPVAAVPEGHDIVMAQKPLPSGKGFCNVPKPPARPADGPNPHARRQWLRTLNAYVSERLAGPQQWAGWEVVAKAEAGALDGHEQRLLDGLDRMMRATRPAAASL